MTYRTSELLPVKAALFSLYDDASLKQNETCVVRTCLSQTVTLKQETAQWVSLHAATPVFSYKLFEGLCSLI